MFGPFKATLKGTACSGPSWNRDDNEEVEALEDLPLEERIMRQKLKEKERKTQGSRGGAAGGARRAAARRWLRARC